MMTDRETVLILGAAGRFGRHAVEAFRQEGWRVRALVRREAPQGVEAVQGDATDAEALIRAAEGADVIVNAVNPPYPAWTEVVPKLTEAVIAAGRDSGATVLVPGNVYNYGSTPPETMTEPPPEDADTRKGRIRCGMELAYRDSGLPVIVLRAGDFIDDRDTGNWFESHLTPGVPKGRMVYPGPLDRVHPWAWLPDVARAAEMLARRRAELPGFASVGFPGCALTGAELVAAVERAAGRPLRVRPMPWTVMRLAAPFSPMLREVLEMRYLWERPHRIDGAGFRAVLPDFDGATVDEAIRASLRGAGRIG